MLILGGAGHPGVVEVALDAGHTNEKLDDIALLVLHRQAKHIEHFIWILLVSHKHLLDLLRFRLGIHELHGIHDAPGGSVVNLGVPPRIQRGLVS